MLVVVECRNKIVVKRRNELFQRIQCGSAQRRDGVTDLTVA